MPHDGMKTDVESVAGFPVRISSERPLLITKSKNIGKYIVPNINLIVGIKCLFVKYR